LGGASLSRQGLPTHCGSGSSTGMPPFSEAPPSKSIPGRPSSSTPFWHAGSSTGQAGSRQPGSPVPWVGSAAVIGSKSTPPSPSSSMPLLQAGSSRRIVKSSAKSSTC